MEMLHVRSFNVGTMTHVCATKSVVSPHLNVRALLRMGALLHNREALQGGYIRYHRVRALLRMGALLHNS